MRRQQGLTLIELMIVVAIIAILTSIALPAYQDSATRAQAAEGLTMMAGAKTGVAEYFIANGVVPVDRSSAGMSANASDTQGQFVVEVDVDNGEIIAKYGNNANAKIAGKTLVLTPYEQADGSVAWQCSSDVAGSAPGGTALSGPTAGTLESRFAPAQCR